MTDSIFIRLAGWAAIITALTTIGVHYIEFPATAFEDRIALAQHTGYIAHKWMIIAHCLCVIISMLGIALLKWNAGRGLMILGMIGYVVFGFTEIGRMVAVLEYLNPLRLEYAAATDPAVKQILRYSIDHFQLVGFALFGVFAIAFALGNLCYGLVLSKLNGVDRWIGYGFLVWAGISVLGMLNDALHWAAIDTIVEYNGKLFQPLFRLIIGIWLIDTVKINRQ